MPPKRRTVAELRSAENATGEEFEAGLILRKVASKTSRNDTVYLAVELGDRAGSFYANIFGESPLTEFFRGTAEGSVVVVTGRVEFYQGRFSPKLMQARVVAENELGALGGIEALVETAPEGEDALRAKLAALIALITHEPLRRTVELAIESVAEKFFTVPAAVSMHHAYRNGLLEHTVHVGSAAAALLPLYPEVPADLALAGVLLHDMGKAIEYEGALASRKTRTGQLQGHVVLGYRIVRRAGMTAKLAPDLLERLEHIVLSHQGELEWGAAVMAATPEAVFVSLVDNLDAKMGMVQRALRIGTDEMEFSDFLPGLKSALLRKPPLTPEAPPEKSLFDNGDSAGPESADSTPTR
jgi:3'-5' exoribonuclease